MRAISHFVVGIEFPKAQHKFFQICVHPGSSVDPCLHTDYLQQPCFIANLLPLLTKFRT